MMSRILRRQGLCGCFSIRKYGYQSFRKPNYYQILRIPESSTQKEIRDAFITLSKELHPDSPHGSHEDFVKVNEAYKILSKRNTKSEYDFHLRNRSHEQEVYDDPYVRPHFTNKKAWESYMARRWGFPDPHREKTETEKRFENMRRHSADQYMMVLIGVVFISMILQYLAIRRSVHVNQDKWMRRSALYDAEYKKIRNIHENQTDEENLSDFAEGYRRNNLDDIR